MTDDELRALVRAAITRHAGVTAEHGSSTPPAPRLHPSHGLLALHDGSEMEGPCIIEPAVPCNHCGYCRSLGH
jgi:hypothetical protein